MFQNNASDLMYCENQYQTKFKSQVLKIKVNFNKQLII
ncbi:hypothetical protein ACINWCA157_1838 [Acinetobacter radioresistens WC-A-157]|nr:hypothetical protein ACINWCA157_1838 [Acinetobacter radioresistens WC-A-157]